MNNQSDNNQVSLQTREWSGRLGTLAGENSTARPAVSTRLSTILDLLRQRDRKDFIDHKIKAHMFVLGTARNATPASAERRKVKSRPFTRSPEIAASTSLSSSTNAST